MRRVAHAKSMATRRGSALAPAFWRRRRIRSGSASGFGLIAQPAVWFLAVFIATAPGRGLALTPRPQEVETRSPALAIASSPGQKPGLSISTQHVESPGEWVGGTRVDDLVELLTAELADDYEVGAAGIELVFDLGGDDPPAAGLVLTPAMAAEGYALEVQDAGAGLEVGRIVVAAADHRGLFYGAMSALELLLDDSANPTDPVAAAEIDVARIRDFPDFTARAGFFDAVLHLGASIDTGALAPEVVAALRDIARHKLNQVFHSTGLDLTDTTHGYRNPVAREVIQAFQLECARLFIEWIPMLDFAGSVATAEQEGVWLSDTPARFRAGPAQAVFNDSFEEDRLLDGWPEGWYTAFINPIGSRYGVGDWDRVPDDPPDSHMMRLTQLDIDPASGPLDPQHRSLSQVIPCPGAGTYVLEASVRITTPLEVVSSSSSTPTPKFAISAFPQDAQNGPLWQDFGTLAISVDNAMAHGSEFVEVHSNGSAYNSPAELLTPRQITITDCSVIASFLVRAYLTSAVATASENIYSGVVELDWIRLVEVLPAVENASLDVAQSGGAEAESWNAQPLDPATCGTAHGAWSYGSFLPFAGAAKAWTGYHLVVPDLAATPGCSTDALRLSQALETPHRGGAFKVRARVATSGLDGAEFRVELIASDASGVDLPAVVASLSNADGLDQEVTIVSDNLNVDLDDFSGLRVEASLPEGGSGEVFIDEIQVYVHEPKVIAGDMPLMKATSAWEGEVVLEGLAADGGWQSLVEDAGFETLPGPPAVFGSAGAWQLNNQAGEVFWSLDTADPHFGEATARLTLAEGEVPSTQRWTANLNQDMSLQARDLSPGHYVLSLWAKRDLATGSAPVAVFVPCGVSSHGAVASVAETTSADLWWRNYWGTIEITAEDLAPGGICDSDAAPRVYLAWFGEGHGSVQFDSISVQRSQEGLTNLRSLDFPPAFQDALGASIDASSFSTPPYKVAGDYDLTVPPPRFLVHEGSTNLADGDPVRVSFDKLLSVDGKPVPMSFCRDQDTGNLAQDLRQFRERVAPTLEALYVEDPLPLPVRSWFTHPSELRGLNKSGACRDPLTGEWEVENGELLSRYLNLVIDEAQSYDPAVGFFSWQDMFSPVNVGGIDDYQVRRFGPVGATSCSVDAGQCMSTPPEPVREAMGMLDWTYWSKAIFSMNAEFDYFSGSGSGTARALYASPANLYDGELNYREWAALARSNPMARGLADFKVAEGEVHLIANATWNGELDRDWSQLAYYPFEESPVADVALNDVVLASGSPSESGCGAFNSARAGNSTGGETLSASASVSMGGIADPGPSQAPSPTRRLRVRFDLFGDTPPLPSVASTWFDSVGGATAAAGQFVEMLPIRDGYGENDFSDFFRYEFDITRPDSLEAVWQSVQIEVQLAAADLCVDNLAIWASDEPCFDCPPPKLDLYDPRAVPEPGLTALLCSGAAFLLLAARRRQRSPEASRVRG